ncbi:hypothetical protein C8R47DRAFT_1073362 [Mycena vitilis]|nr:hypothetical protein C8R47DRAFT_1073362 [Mycena vitilis]
MADLASERLSLPSGAQAFLDANVPALQRGTEDYVKVTSSSLLAAMKENTDLQTVLARDRVPMLVEKSHRICSEADVERPIHLYILRGLHEILERYLKQCKPKPRTLICTSQVSEDKSRVDMQWTVNKVPVFLLEVRNWGALREADWSVAVAHGVTEKARSEAGNKKKAECRDSGKHTAVKDNAFHILKQVTKYTRTYDVPAALIFDWGRMVYLDMMPNGQMWDEEGNPPLYLSMAEDEPNQRWTFRKLFLAAFMNALERAEVD